MIAVRPWGWPRPEDRLYVVLTDREAAQLADGHLLMRGEVHGHANQVLNKHGWVACVPFYDMRGKLLKMISREE